MSEKKNIDRLFQEKFKDFEATPPEYVWENIEAELKQKKKKRVIPLWFKLGGAAAVLLLGMWLINPFDNGIEVNDNPVVNSNNTMNDDAAKPNNENIGSDAVTPTNSIQDFDTDEAVVADTENNPAKANEGNNSGTDINQSKTVINENNGLGGNANNAVANNNSGTNAKSNTAVSEGRNISSQKENSQHLSNKNAVAYSDKAKNQDNNNNGGIGNGNEQNNVENKSGIGINSSMTPNDGTAVAQNEYDKNANTVKESNAQNDSHILTDKEIITEEAIAETVVDTAGAEVPENELEKLLQEKLNGEKEDKDEMVAENSDNRKWNIKPQVAPVFYNSLSEGSPIDSQFAGNTKDYDNNLSYGVGVDYALNDRISIRSGINTVNLSYSTRGVAFYPSMSKQTNNVSGTSAARAANFVVQNEGAAPDGLPSASQQTFNGSMLQEMGYIEVPVEMSYAVLNKKFGIDVIGGFSTLFLNENNVSVVTTQGLSSSLGEAENLNNVHFSTNVGIGFKYRFFKSFQASFEPTFKYQINTFSGSSGNFKPYFIGLYFGWLSNNSRFKVVP